jgi:hypothetical protein
MALSFIGSASGFNDAGGSVTITLPGGVAEGDVVYVCGGTANVSDIAVGVSTAGYTELVDIFGTDTQDTNFAVDRKVMGSTPDSTAVCIGSGDATIAASYVMHVWRGANTTTPEDVTTTTATGIDSGTPNSPSISPVTTGAVVLTAGAGNNFDTSTTTAPTGYANQVDVDAGNLSRLLRAMMASKSWSGSGAEDPAAWTISSTDVSFCWAAATIAIRPAPAPDATPTCPLGVFDPLLVPQAWF